MKKIIFVLFSVLIVAGFVSCKKSSSSKSKTEFLTQAGWKQTGGEVRTTTTAAWGVDPSFTSTPACQKDNVILFRTNNTVENNEGATKCNAADPQIVFTGSWAFQDNESKISVMGDVVAIEQLDDQTLRITYSDTFSGTTYYYRETYTH
jgi:hypothetical protein